MAFIKIPVERELGVGLGLPGIVIECGDSDREDVIDKGVGTGFDTTFNTGVDTDVDTDDDTDDDTDSNTDFDSGGVDFERVDEEDLRLKVSIRSSYIF